MNHPYW